MHGYATLDYEAGIRISHASLSNIIDRNHTVPVAITASVCGVVAAHSIHVSAPSLCENSKTHSHSIYACKNVKTETETRTRAYMCENTDTHMSIQSYQNAFAPTHIERGNTL